MMISCRCRARCRGSYQAQKRHTSSTRVEPTHDDHRDDYDDGDDDDDDADGDDDDGDDDDDGECGDDDNDHDDYDDDDGDKNDDTYNSSSQARAVWISVETARVVDTQHANKLWHYPLPL